MSTPTFHPDPRSLDDYRAGRLPVAESLALSDHLVGCAACRAILAAGTAPGRVRHAGLDFGRLPDEPAPTYEEMAALLDGLLDERQAADVRGRLAQDPVANAEFADLQRFRDESPDQIPRVFSPADPRKGQTVSDDPIPGNVTVFPGGWRGRFGALAAAALVVLTAGWWLTTAGRSQPTRKPWLSADLSGLPADLRRSVEAAARSGVPPVAPLPAGLRPEVGALSGPAAELPTFRPIAPLGVVVRELRPTLSWTARPGAKNYRVDVIDLDRREPMLTGEVPADRTDWTAPRDLRRGAMYEWQVEAVVDGATIERTPRPPAPEARFLVLDQRSSTELERVENRYAASPLVLGTAYARLGLDDLALLQYTRLLAESPRSSVLRRLAATEQQRLAHASAAVP